MKSDLEILADAQLAQLLAAIPLEHRSTAKAYAALRVAEAMRILHERTGAQWVESVRECQLAVASIDAAEKSS